MTINHAGSGKKLRWTTWLGLILVPVLLAGGLLWATWNSDDRMDEVRAAVVNQDVAVELQGQLVPMGRQLTAALVDSDREQNLAWEQATLDGAEAGLKTGEYAAMVVIPEDFSAAATSYAGDAQDAYSATIQVQTSPVAGIADATLGKVVAQEAAQVLNESLTSAYLDQIYVGFNQMGEQFVTLADAASQLSDGADQLSDGASELSNGLNQTASGVSEFATGVNQAASGTQQYAAGVSQYAGGVSQLAGGVSQYAVGVDQYASGVGQYAAGMNTLSEQVQPLPAGAQQLAQGAQQSADGVGQYVDGVNQVVNPMIDVLSQYPELAETIQQITGDQEGLDQAVAYMRAAQDGVAELEQMSGWTVEQLAQEKNGSEGFLDCPLRTTTANGMDCDAYWAAVQAGITTANQTMADARQDEDLGPIIDDLEKLPDQLAGIQLPSGGVDVLEMATQLRDGGEALKGGTSQLADGVTQFAGGMQPLVDGINQTTDAANQLTSGANQLSDGADQLADGANQLNDGTGQLVDGANQLSDGMTQLSSGAGQLTDGVNQLADGGSQFSEGVSQYADGMSQFADGIAQGKDQIPSYSDSDRDNLADVVASPVATGNLTGTATLGTGWATALLVLALWAGAMATFMVVKVLSKRLLSSARPSAYLVGEALLPGVIVVSVQAVAVTAIGQAALGLPFAKLAGLLGISLVAGLAFVAVNHALVAWFGRIGRFVSLAFVVIAMAPLVTDAIPGLFATLRAISPMSPALDAMRSLITSSGGTAVAVFQLLLWLLLGLVASAAAIIKHRTTTMDDLVSAQTSPD